MSKPHFFQKLAPMGVASLSAIAVFTGLGISATPAQALTFTEPSSLGWSDATDDWFDEVQPGPGDTFDVLFNFDPNTIVVTNATGEFVPDFSTGIVSMDNAPQLVEFLYVEGSGTEADPAIYETQNVLTMSFDPDPNSTGNPSDATEYDWVVPIEGISTRVTGFQSTPNDWEFSLCSTCGEEPYMEVDGMVNPGQNTWQFSQGSEETQGNYTANYQNLEHVPEPTTILSLLAVGGLGLGLKRKKQVS